MIENFDPTEKIDYQTYMQLTEEEQELVDQALKEFYNEEELRRVEYNRKKKQRRCYQRVISGIKRGGVIRFLTLTSGPEARQSIQKSWEAMYKRMKRRGLIEGYIKIPERTKNGREHLHILFRGKYIPQKLLSKWWDEIHHSKVVDIRFVKLKGGSHKIANYVSKYMSKDTAGRYSWSWGWVWRGFCKDWDTYRRYWWKWFHVEGKTTFRNCIKGWDFWLRGIYQIDREGLREQWPPGYVFTLNTKA